MTENEIKKDDLQKNPFKESEAEKLKNEELEKVTGGVILTAEENSDKDSKFIPIK